jgi:S1-C subfamily serine protease
MVDWRQMIASWNKALLLAVITWLASAMAGSASERHGLAGARALEEAFTAAIKKAEPAVACILVSHGDDHRGTNQADGDPVPESFGSGVVIEGKRGLILTNYHVIRDYQRISVRLPDRISSDAELYVGDPRSDLAVIQVKNQSILPLKEIHLGDGDNVKKGQFVLSIANPYAAGFQDGSPSASWGIISNIRRRAPSKGAQEEQDRARLTLHHFGTLLQIDARLNLGCSGGALVDLNGDMIGLTTALAAITGTETSGGFAVPITTQMKRIIQVLKEGREVEYGFLGVGFPAASSYRGTGATVGFVYTGSPAEEAGLRAGDQIVSVNGQPIHDTDDLFLAVGSQLAGTLTKLGVRASTEDLTVKLAKYYVPGPVVIATKPKPVRGMRVDYTSVLVQRDNSRSPILQGVYVRETLPGSPAERAHLLDAIITHVNNQPVRTPAEFYALAAKATGPLELTVLNPEENSQPRTVKLD